MYQYLVKTYLHCTKNAGLQVVYLQNKGFYKGFFYPEYRFLNKNKG